MVVCMSITLVEFYSSTFSVYRQYSSPYAFLFASLRHIRIKNKSTLTTYTNASPLKSESIILKIHQLGYGLVTLVTSNKLYPIILLEVTL